ncbi:MAG TPA: YceI family protein [Wenzhouxiangellaceae bacterium]|nr:YceI family protein [Wenzhouxiangellaceae bacterium]
MVGCAAAPQRNLEESASVAWPTFAAPQAGEDVYRIDPEASQLRIRVDPEGPMARLGHSHVIGGSVFGGIVALGEGHQSARLDLRVDVSALQVDKPQWRADAGLETELDDAAISGTRNNMLGARVLDAQRYPEISIRSTGIEGPAWLPDVTVRIRLRGQVREIVVPVAVERTGTRLTASGAMDLLQSDFGIEPFSAAGGTLRVSDRMRIRFRIIAEKIPANP